MAIISFGEYRPDVTDYKGQYSHTIFNAVPQGDGYGPFKKLSAVTSALAAPCRGIFHARKSDGSIVTFAGTTTKLYQLNNTDLTWTDVSKSASTYTALSTGHNWQFVQFNNDVVAVQQNAPPQVFDISTDSAFSDLGGTPPNAAYVTVINRFLLLGGIESHVFRVQWSDLDDITNWSTGQSDFQDLADGGLVRGISGGEFGLILQDSSIRRMIYAPGSPYVFSIDRISIDDGLLSPYSLVQAGDRVFFASPQGFKMLPAGGYPVPIGREKIDRTFFADFDKDSPEFFLGAHDPKSQRVFWSYRSLSAPNGVFDSILCYDWILDKWSKLTFTGQFITSLARSGITLENIDDAFGSDIDTIVLSSFDDISVSSSAALSGVDSSNAVGFFTGDNLEATLVTPEQGDDIKRIRIRGLRPVTDATASVGSIVYRDTAQSSTTTTAESAINSIGQCDQNINTRYARGKLRIPEGATWTYAAGIEPDVVTVGRR